MFRYCSEKVRHSAIHE